jgi:spermidine/putrescine transport system ATP-binding protein
MPSTQAVEVENVTRTFGAVRALDRVSLSIRQGEFFSLLGPSGCGKTTLLRILAGLEVPDEGVVRIGGVDTRGVPAHRRPVNTVFQSYALFPHLDVRENVAFGLRMKRVGPAEIEQRVRQVMELVEIQPLSARKPNQLSGGQKQRVALARALINQPQVLLLDEPLAALDLKLRKQLQMELLNLQRRLGITFIYVTHDQEEALALSDRIAVMREGKLEQIGEAEAVYNRPRTRFASQFLGSCSLIEATADGSKTGGVLVQTPVGRLRVAAPLPARNPFTLAIRPEKVHLAPAPLEGQDNQIRVRIVQLVYVGSETHYELRCGPQLLHAEMMNQKPGSGGFQVGQDAWVCLPPESLIILDD